jgi:hypothetical protein
MRLVGICTDMAGPAPSVFMAWSNDKNTCQCAAVDMVILGMSSAAGGGTGWDDVGRHPSRGIGQG